MSAVQTAYRTADPEVLAEYEKWKTETLAVNRKRAELYETLGRHAYINGSGYNTYIVGFERFDNDQTGDLVHDGRLIVSSKRGHHNGLVVPNLKRAAGKQFEVELKQYTTRALDLSGLPGMHVYGTGTGQMVVGHANVWCTEYGVLYALWGCDDAPMGEQWEQVPLSIYYTAFEQYEADAANNAPVSGNTDEGEQA